MTALIIIISLTALYILSTMGRRGHPGLDALRSWRYAHRGLHGNGIPENSIAAFRAALEGGYGIELDVHLMKDGTLAIIHDASLKRTAGADVKIEDLSAEDLPRYFLEGTWETIPTLPQVLSLFDGKAPLIIELKPMIGNHAELTQAVCDLLSGYQGAYCIESFDPRCIFWLRKNRPDIIRGQLTEDFVHNPRSPLPMVLKFIMTHQMANFLTLPDFVAYKFSDRKTISNTLVRQFWGVQGVTWTVTSQRDLDIAEKEGWIPIFEGFRP